MADSTTTSTRPSAQVPTSTLTPMASADHDTLEAPGALTTLSHVNVPYSQTWNHLNVNEVSLRMPQPIHRGEVTARLPQILRQVEAGIGAEAVAWVESSAGDARYIEVPRGTHREEPLLVEANANAGEVRDTGILVREGAHATVAVVSYAAGAASSAGSTHTETATTVSAARASHRHSANLVRIIAERNATVRIVEIIALGEDSTHLEGIGIEADGGASIEVRQYALGGGQVALGFEAQLRGRSSRLQLDLRYVARGHERLDVNQMVRQRGLDTRCDIQSTGVLADSAHKTLRETIDLVHGAKGSKGNEAETVLVTGDDVVNRTLPVILCDEDDVAGNHGASIGSVSAEQLAYLRDRGLSEGEAVALFSRAIFDDAAIHAPEDASLVAALDRAAEVLGDEIAHDLADGLGLTDGLRGSAAPCDGLGLHDGDDPQEGQS